MLRALASSFANVSIVADLIRDVVWPALLPYAPLYIQLDSAARSRRAAQLSDPSAEQLSQYNSNAASQPGGAADTDVAADLPQAAGTVAGLSRPALAATPTDAHCEAVAAAVRPRARVAVSAEKPLSGGEQWGRLSRVLDDAITSSRSAERLQAAAQQQIDLAQYAFASLSDELAAVMSLPASLARGTVFTLERPVHHPVAAAASLAA